MGTIKATNIEPIADNGTVTLGSSGDTFSLGSGVVQNNLNYPAFYAYISSSQSVSDNVTTKVQINTELLDTDNCYDNSTNYRFTPNKAGRYLVFGCVSGESNTTDSVNAVETLIYFNGSAFTNPNLASSGAATRFLQTSMAVVNMNGSSDYIELFGKVNINSGTAEFNSGAKQTYFCAYRIGS